MGPTFRLFAGAVLAGLLLTGAATAQAPTGQTQLAANTTPVPAASITTAPTADYVLGSGDKLRVTTFGESALTGEFQVGADGKVALPLIGDQKAGGLTVSQLQASMEAALKQGYIKEPRVSIEVLTYRPFYILGEVNKPGTYAYTGGLTVLNAVATAEGFTYRANTKKVFIKHAGAATEEGVKLDTATPVAPGDTIRITERFF